MGDIPYRTFHYWCKRVETFHWIKEEYPKVTPKSPIGKARAYSLKREKELTLFLSDGRVEIDNNKIEKEIDRLHPVGRIFMFAGTHESAQRMAMIYSLMATCKANCVEPIA